MSRGALITTHKIELLKARLPIAEITFRTAAAEGAIRALTTELPELLVGAGTVLTVDQVRSAMDAGARFMVAPGFNPTVVDYCREHDICVVPGVNNPSQIESALERKLSVLKFFAAEASGGLPFLKAVAAPYGDIRFMPIGRINLQNLMSYLSFPRVIACGGSWMVASDLISASNFTEIEQRSHEAVAAINMIL